MAHPRRRLVWLLLPTAVVTVATTLILVVTLTDAPQAATSNNPAEHTQPPAGTVVPVAKLLTPFSTCSALLSGLRKHAADHAELFGPYGGIAVSAEGAIAGGGAAPSVAYDAKDAASAGSGASSAGTSATNIQEAGVDEPDTVKTDGDRVVTVADGHLRVVDASTRTLAGTLDLTMYSGWPSAQLLTSGEHALVLLPPSNGYGGGPYPAQGGAADAMPTVPSGGNADARSTVLYVDLAGTPKVVGTMQADGHVVDARMVGTTVRLVVASSPRLNLPTPTGPDSPSKSAIKSAIGRQPLDAWLPTYSVNGGSTATVACTQVSHPKDYTAASTVTLYTLNPAAPNADPQPVSVEADGDTVYATQTSLYVASNPYCASCYGPGLGAGSSTTQLHRFDITGTGKPRYLGSGSVPGSLLNQYSLSDFHGSLRVATTIAASRPAGNTGSEAIAATSSSVYVLDAGTLAVTGHVDGLGKGERVYAVRFLGPLGYVVTYNQVDPLYVLDLADAHRPRLAGSLELNGFSSYLHDVGAGRLVGVGQDTTPVSEGGGVYAHLNGLLVQMFDVHNASKPARTSHIVLSDTPGQAQFDPHAFLYWQPTGLVVVPVGTWSGAQTGTVLAVRVSGATLIKLGTVANRGSSDRSPAIQRSMIVNGALWTFSASGIRVSNQANLAEQAWIDFG